MIAQNNTARREIAPNTGANTIKFFSLVTKSWKLVAKLANELKRFVKINPRQTSSLSLFPKQVSLNVVYHPSQCPRTGYHFEKFKSQVATRKKKLHALYSLCLCQRWLIVNLSCLSLLSGYKFMFPKENIKNTFQTRDRLAFCSTEKNSIK